MSSRDAFVSLPIPDARPPHQGEACRKEAVPLSGWSESAAKRVFDLMFVVGLAPFIFPSMAILAIAVRLISGGPALFRQTRIGIGGVPFTILKFRTMLEANPDPCGIASSATCRITPLGRILRRFKLDELPQFINVLRGEMSLVGPRPKIPEQQVQPPPCRPGITGAATLAFAREELLLNRIPPDMLVKYYQDEILPTKNRIDCEYMARATMWSDLGVLMRTALGRWQVAALQTGEFEGERDVLIRSGVHRGSGPKLLGLESAE
jgi:lipopolysaccharide/colanic/teichoic acid biosynthesis glycosyltransferase